MRSLAFVGFLLAAFDAPVPWLDRAGVAAVALALLALALPGRVRWARPKVPPWGSPLPANQHVFWPPTEQDDSGDEAELLDPMPERP